MICLRRVLAGRAAGRERSVFFFASGGSWPDGLARYARGGAAPWQGPPEAGEREKNTNSVENFLFY